MEKKYVLSVLVENHAGVLSRVSGLFSRRGYNIDSLTVCETSDPNKSRMTIVVRGDEYILEQIEKQLSKYWFARIHNRYLVNCRMISSIEKNSCKLLNGEELPVSRAKMAHTKEMFQSYLRSTR